MSQVAQTSSKPKVHRLPRRARTPLYIRALKTTLEIARGNRIALIAGAAGFFVVSAVLVHVSKLLSESTFIPEAAAHAGLNGEKPAKSIIIKGNDGEIIGQVTKFADPDDKMGDINTMREVDNKANRDLLSVVNKY